MVYINVFSEREIFKIRELILCRYMGKIIMSRGDKAVINSINGKQLPIGEEGWCIQLAFKDINCVFSFAQDLRKMGIFHDRSFFVTNRIMQILNN